MYRLSPADLPRLTWPRNLIALVLLVTATTRTTAHCTTATTRTTAHCTTATTGTTAHCGTFSLSKLVLLVTATTGTTAHCGTFSLSKLVLLIAIISAYVLEWLEIIPGMAKHR